MYKFIAIILSCLITYPSYAAVDKTLLQEMLTTLNNKYLEHIDNISVANTGLSALHDLDNNLIISKGRDRFYIYYNHQINNFVAYPKDTNNIQQWSETLEKVINNAAELSETISIKDFEIPDLMMKKITADLDKYSAYYSQYDYRENQEENAIYTLYSDRIIDKDYLYIKARIFNKQTANMIKQSLEKNPAVKGIILDLRGNSGGIFNEAIKVAGLFTENEIITYSAGRDNQNIHYYTSSETPALYNGPLVIMIDGNTASAAEVLAGGMQEQSRAKLIGTRSFGKGTIQSITKMSNGGKLVLTTAQFFTPGGKIIHNQGITPDSCLDTADDNSCRQSDRLKFEDDITLSLRLLKGDI